MKKIGKRDTKKEKKTQEQTKKGLNVVNLRHVFLHRSPSLDVVKVVVNECVDVGSEARGG